MYFHAPVTKDFRSFPVIPHQVPPHQVPEDIYKSHLENVRPYGPTNVDSARQNLAASFVNGFVNCAFGQDKLLAENGNKWLYKNKEHGKEYMSPY